MIETTNLPFQYHQGRGGDIDVMSQNFGTNSGDVLTRISHLFDSRSSKDNLKGE